MSIQHLEYYGWEIAWRQTMVGSPNDVQLHDLLQRLLQSGRPTRFVDYWSKRAPHDRPDPRMLALAVEVSVSDIARKMGRPRKDSLARGNSRTDCRADRSSSWAQLQSLRRHRCGRRASHARIDAPIVVCGYQGLNASRSRSPFSKARGAILDGVMQAPPLASVSTRQCCATMR